MYRALLKLLVLKLHFLALLLLVALVAIFVPHPYKNIIATPLVVIGCGFIVFRAAKHVSQTFTGNDL